MTIRFLAVARQELDGAVAWYERQSPDLDYEFLDELDRVVRRVSAYPQSNAELTRDLRRALFSRFPYGLIYGIDADSIVVVAVAHLHPGRSSRLVLLEERQYQRHARGPDMGDRSGPALCPGGLLRGPQSLLP